MPARRSGAVPRRARQISAPKLAALIAREIEDEVVARGWPVGALIGSERSLLDRYRVSGSVLREAVRIVEHHGVATMRRGLHGGLVVVAPSTRAVVDAMSIWFSYANVSIDEILGARTPLLGHACRLAVARGSANGDLLERLRHALGVLWSDGSPGPAALASLDGLVGDLSGNPALSLFVRANAGSGLALVRARRLRADPPPTEADLAALRGAYAAIAAAVESGDDRRAQIHVRALTSVFAGRLYPRSAPAEDRRAEPAAGLKLAEVVAATIRGDVERSGWRVGTVIGSEHDLIDRYHVSRAALREAVRILELHGVVRTKRGPHGGFVVAEPDSTAVVRAARLALEYAAVSAAQIDEVRAAVSASGAAPSNRPLSLFADVLSGL